MTDNRDRDPTKGLGEHLKRLRIAAKMTQSFVARATKVSTGTISQRESGLTPVDAAVLGELLALYGAGDIDRLACWRLHLEAQGHPLRDAESMALAKTGQRAGVA